MSLDREIKKFVEAKGGDYNAQLDKLEEGLVLALRSVSAQSRNDVGVNFSVNVKNSHGGTFEDVVAYLGILKNWDFVTETDIGSVDNTDFKFYYIQEYVGDPDLFHRQKFKMISDKIETARQHYARQPVPVA